MAYSTQRAVSDGTLDYLALAIDYFDREEISVYFDGLISPLEPGGPWAWVGATQAAIQFDPPVADGVEVMLQRSTKLDSPLHVFNQGAQFKNSTMDENFSQMLRIAQEAKEGGQLGDIFNDLDMHGYQIKNIGLATEDDDALSLAQYKADANGAFQQRVLAETARAQAQGFRNEAQTFRNQAETFATNAGNSASTATTQATAATTARNQAEGFRNEAQTARTNAQAAQAGAEAALEEVQDIMASGLWFTGDVKIGFFNTAPTGWQILDGRAVPRTGATAGLFAIFGTTHGAGDGSTTFNLPQVGGEYLRFWQANQTVDSGRALGSKQGAALLAHTHVASSAGAGAHTHTATQAAHSHTATQGSHSHGASQAAHAHNVPTRNQGGTGFAGIGYVPEGLGNAVTNVAVSSAQPSVTVNSASAGAITVSSQTPAITVASNGVHTHPITVDSTGDAEQRVRSIAMCAIIKE